MDWASIFTTLIAAGVGALVAVLVPALVFAYWLGGLNMRVTASDARCSSECERQTREHSRLFQISDEHGRAIGKLQGDVKSLDRRVAVVEGPHE